MADAPTNMVTWFQLPAEEEARAWTFYKRVFGWTPEDAYGPPREGAIRGEISKRTALSPTSLSERIQKRERTSSSVRP